MWEEDRGNKIDKLNINKGFARKFDERKKREELEKAKVKYGRDLNDMLDGSGSSSSAPEDEVGDLVTGNIESKFIKTLAKLRTKDPEIYNQKKFFFDEKDFDEVPLQGKKNKEKPVFYKDLVRQTAMDDKKNNKRTPREVHEEEQEDLKNAFKMAANGVEDEDLLKVRKKSKKQIEDENTEFNKFLEAEKEKSKPAEVDLLQRFWGDETQLDETDKFLRKYILTKGWIDKDETKYTGYDEADEEDSLREDEMDNFEAEYNFRYEEPGATQVLTYSREHPESLRQDAGKRKEKRLEKEQRKKDIIAQEKEDIKHLKSIRKQEILDRLKKIEETAGSELKDENIIDKIIGEDFDPEKYDKVMNEQFGEDYYENEDQEENELEDYIKQQEEEYDQMYEENPAKEDEDKKETAANGKKESKQADASKDDQLLATKAAIPIFNRVNLKEAETKEIANALGNLWWYCDTCFKGIKEGHPRFECLECEDFCQCKACADLKDHPHKMKKFVVPQGCAPPSDKEIAAILESTRFCAECSYKFTEYDYMFELKKNAEFLICEDCLKTNERQYKEKDFNKIEPKKVDVDRIVKEDVSKLKGIYKDKELDELIDSYYQLDFEDVISGGIKTRFKYVDVNKNSYGLTDEDILYADDRTLNQFVSLKKMQPYRPDDGQVNMKTLRKKKNEVKKAADKNKKGVDKEVKKFEQKEEEMKKAGASKEEIKEEMRKQKIALGVKIAKKQHLKGKVRLLKEEDVVDDVVEDNEEPEHFEPKGKKMKVDASRLKSYGLV